MSESMIYDRVTKAFCTVSFLEVSLLVKLNFWCCIGGVCVAATRNISLSRDFSIM
jgi:hypothetical protein